MNQTNIVNSDNFENHEQFSNIQLLCPLNGQKSHSTAQISVLANEVNSCKIPWLIENFIARGTLNSLQGLADSGKTWVSLALTSAVACGGEFPDSKGNLVIVPQGRVLYANFDDHLNFTVKPRLESIMGVGNKNFENIKFIKSESGIYFGDKRLAKEFADFKPDLAIFDTLQHFIGKVDMHRANDVNSAMIEFKNLVEKHNTAVVIIQHIGKNSASGNGGSSVNWGIGSVAINGLFRSVWTIGKLVSEDFPYRRAIVPSKINLLPSTPPARLFDLIPDGGLQWVGVDSDVSVFDLLNGDGDLQKKKPGRPPKTLEKAKEFLVEILSKGEVEQEKIKFSAYERDISWRTIERAKSELKIKSYQKNIDGKVKSCWCQNSDIIGKIDEE